MLTDVKPGSVFSSFSTTRFVPRSTKKSTRAMPQHLVARNAATESARICSVTACGNAAGMMSSVASLWYFAA